MPAAVRSGAGASSKMARGHSKVRPVYRCDQCDYDTTHKGHLMEHQRTHTGERPHKCTMCKYTGSSKGHLASHMRKKHPDYKPYKCNQCDFVGNFSRDLVAHRWKHTGEQPIFCTECDYATPCKANMTAHYKRKHPGKRPTKSVRPVKTIPRSSIDEAAPLPSSSTRSPMSYTLYPSPPPEVETTVEYPSSTSGTSDDYISRSNSPAMSSCDSPFFHPDVQQPQNEFNFFDEHFDKSKPSVMQNVMSHEEFQNKLPAFATFTKMDVPNFASIKRETAPDCDLSSTTFQTDAPVHPAFDSSWWQSSVLTPPAEEYQTTADHFSWSLQNLAPFCDQIDDPYSIHDTVQLPHIAKSILRDFDANSHFIPVNTERHSKPSGTGRPYSPYDEIDVLELERYL